jgi:hypothetical protein
MVLSIHGWSLHDSELDGTFPGDMHDISIFSKWSTRARMLILIANSKSSQKTEFDEYDIIDMQAHSIFGSVYF